MSEDLEIRSDVPAAKEPGDSSSNNKKYKPFLIAAVLFAGTEAAGVILWEISDGLHDWLSSLSHWGSLSCFGIGPWLALYERTKKMKWPVILSTITVLTTAIAAFAIWPPHSLSPQALYWTQFIAVAVLAISGWIPFALISHRLRQAEKRITDSLSELDVKIKRIFDENGSGENALFRVSEDFQHNDIAGYYVDLKTKSRVCARCLHPPSREVVPLHQAAGSSFDGEGFALVWRCGKCDRDYWYEKTEDAPPFF